MISFKLTNIVQIVWYICFFHFNGFLCRKYLSILIIWSPFDLYLTIVYEDMVNVYINPELPIELSVPNQESQ